MFKKTLMTTALVLASSASFAANGYNGFYAGADIGSGQTDTGFNQVVSTGAYNPVASNGHASRNVLLANFFAGYTESYGNFVFGGEFNIDGNQHNKSTVYAEPARAVSLRMDRGFGFSLLPGFKANDTTLVYARVGIERTHYQISDNQAAYGLSINDNGYVNGARVGLGLSHAVADNLDARLEYNHINYQGFKKTAVLNDGQVLNEKFNPRDNRVVVGLSYHFG